jgi:3-isopropylmalate dehydratase small subunit
VKIEGRVWRLPDNVDTDQIIAARHLNQQDPAFLASHCLEDLEPRFARECRPGDVVVAGRNFGCGSSREHAVVALKAAGVRAVIAESLARIFYRNAINLGLPAVACPGIGAWSGATLELDLAAGTAGDRRFAPMPEFFLGILECGGLVAWVRRSRCSGETGSVRR